MRLIDSHSHFDAEDFDGDRIQALTRAKQAGINDQIVPAITAERWPALKAVCATDVGLHPAYGLHPVYLADHYPADLNRLIEWIEREKPIAVGECGLDFFIDDLDREQQQFYLQRQLQIAKDFDLPVILHARRAFDAVIVAIRRTGSLRGVVHSFSGSAEQARQLYSLGFYLGIGGPVTYPRANRLRDLVANMPLEYLLLETDSPDQPGCAHRGQRNEPAYLIDVVKEIARLRGQSELEIAEATTANARRLFGLA